MKNVPPSKPRCDSAVLSHNIGMDVRLRHPDVFLRSRSALFSRSAHGQSLWPSMSGTCRWSARAPFEQIAILRGDADCAGKQQKHRRLFHPTDLSVLCAVGRLR